MKNRIYSFAILPMALSFLSLRSDIEPLTKETKAQTIDSLTTALKEGYVFEEAAKKVDRDLHERLSKGEYDGIDKGEEFAKALSEHVNALCHDAHLRVRFSKEELPKRVNRAEPSKEEIAARERFMRLMNGGVVTVERLVGNVGYIDTTNFLPLESAKRSISAAMAFVENTDALIIDMRANGGGSPDTVQYFCSYLFDGKPILLNTLEFRGRPKREFWTLKRLPGKRYVNREVYVLVGKRTASAAEEFSYNLKNLHRATIVGESTWGGANPGGVERLNDHFAVFVSHGRAVNPYTHTNWEGTGVEPDVRVPAGDAFKTAHVAAIKALLAKATSEEDKQRLTEALKAAESGQKQ